MKKIVFDKRNFMQVQVKKYLHEPDDKREVRAQKSQIINRSLNICAYLHC